MQVYSAEWVLPVAGAPIANGAVAVEDGLVTAVGTQDELGRGEHFGAAAIFPGFVNAHTHLEYAAYAGFGDTTSFGPWLATHVERKARIGFDEMCDVARWGAAQSLASGVTTVGDASFAGAAAVACTDLGLRGIVYLEVFGSDPDGAVRQFENTRARVDGLVGPLVSLGVSPHAPYSTSPEVYREAVRMNLPLMTHLNESQDELDYLLRGEGPMSAASHVLIPPIGETGIVRLARDGLLGPNWVAAHCVKVSGEEIGLLREADVAVAHCPRSNGFLGCGFAPLAAFRAAGLRVGIGTDGVSSTPSPDLFDELRAVAVVARAREERAAALTGAELLELATLGSARALGLDAVIGSLEAGKRADLAVVGLEGSGYHPVEDPAAAVVFGGAPERVLLTVVDGEERYRKGTTDWHGLRSAASSARSRLLGLSGAATARSSPRS